MPKHSVYDYRAVQLLQLPDPITCTRTYPVTAHGDALLRAIRRSIQDDIIKASGKDIQVPFPTALYMMMKDYASIKGIEVLDEDKVPLPKAG